MTIADVALTNNVDMFHSGETGIINLLMIFINFLYKAVAYVCYAISQVKLDFTEESNLPGVATPLHLQAAPGSVCSLHVLDKSVKLHGGDDRLDVNKVTNSMG